MNLRAAVALSFVVTFAACSAEHSGDVVGPLSVAQVGAARRVMPNAVAYGHGGVRPATGRSGSAALLASAVFGGAGTVVTVKSYRADDLSFTTPTGTIERLQLKAYTAAGRLAWTRNISGFAASHTVQFMVTDLDAGMRLAVQALVRGIDARRTDVVTTATFVVARPANLRLGPVSAAERWHLGVPLVITALVTETGGDLDVTASCALYVDGALAERITNVLVVAGDQVSCNFTHTFTTIGTHELRIALEQMTPGDNNPLDNQLVRAVDVYAPEGALLPVFNYSAEAQDITLSEYDSTVTVVHDLASGLLVSEGAYVSWSAGRDQSSHFNGIFESRLAFPLARLVLVQRTGATVIHADTLEDLPMNGGGPVPCTVGSGPGGITYSLCSYDDGLSMLHYARQAGTVAYRTQSYNLLMDPESCTDLDGCWVLTLTEDNGTPDTWGPSLSYEVSITAGDTVLAAAPTVPLATVNEQTVYGPECSTAIRTDSTAGPFGIIIELERVVSTCSSGFSNRTGLAGAGSGVGVSELRPLP